jgi:hypothetical protein
MIVFLNKATRGSFAITKRSCLVNQRCLKKFYNKAKALPVLNIGYNKLLRHYSFVCINVIKPFQYIIAFLGKAMRRKPRDKTHSSLVKRLGT